MSRKIGIFKVVHCSMSLKSQKEQFQTETSKLENVELFARVSYSMHET